MSKKNPLSGGPDNGFFKVCFITLSLHQAGRFAPNNYESNQARYEDLNHPADNGNVIKN